MPADMPVADPEFFYRELQVPRTIDSKTIGQFFATQGRRLYALEHVDKIKTHSGEVHDFDDIAQELEAFSPMTGEEEQLLEGLQREIGERTSGGLVGVQAAGGDLTDLIDRAEQYVKGHPASSSTSAGSGGPSDIFDTLFMTEVQKQKSERDEKYKMLLAQAKDPETIVMIIAEKYTDLYGEKLSKLMPAYRDQLDKLDQMTARMSLEGASSAQIAAANTEVAKATSFMGMTTFAIQSVKQKIDQVQNISQSVLGSIHESAKQVIANFRG